MRRSVKYTIVVAAIIGGLVGLYFIFGYVRTPVIHGTVLDAETKHPVENAWVTATLSLKVATIQGDVHVHPSIAPPHLRTNKEGKFIIPRKSFRQPLPPLGFGMDVEGCRVSVETTDDRQGEVNPLPSLWKWWAEVTIYVKPTTMTEGQYDSYLQSLYRYCIMGRSGVEVPAVREGCDAWELDYAIAKHERFIKKLERLEAVDQKTYQWGTRRNIAYLYKQRGDYEKALSTFEELKKSDEKRGSKMWLTEFNTQIKELQHVRQK
jgi:hypothetical protein